MQITHGSTAVLINIHINWNNNKDNKETGFVCESFDLKRFNDYFMLALKQVCLSGILCQTHNK